MKILKCLLPTLLLFTTLDFLWLAIIGKPLYFKYLNYHLNISNGSLSAQLLPALIVYILFAIMIWSIVLPLSDSYNKSAFQYGALLGLVVYGIYDMTNMSVLKSWPLQIAIIDWLWGIFICSICSGFCQYIKSKSL